MGGGCIIINLKYLGKALQMEKSSLIFYRKSYGKWAIEIQRIHYVHLNQNHKLIVHKYNKKLYLKLRKYFRYGDKIIKRKLLLMYLGIFDDMFCQPLQLSC